MRSFHPSANESSRQLASSSLRLRLSWSSHSDQTPRGTRPSCTCIRGAARAWCARENGRLRESLRGVATVFSPPRRAESVSPSSPWGIPASFLHELLEQLLSVPHSLDYSVTPLLLSLFLSVLLLGSFFIRFNTFYKWSVELMSYCTVVTWKIWLCFEKSAEIDIFRLRWKISYWQGQISTSYGRGKKIIRNIVSYQNIMLLYIENWIKIFCFLMCILLSVIKNVC